MLRDLGLGLGDIEVATRVVIFPQGLRGEYFADVGRHAAAAARSRGRVGSGSGIDDLKQRQALFGTVGYFLFTTRT